MLPHIAHLLHAVPSEQRTKKIKDYNKNDSHSQTITTCIPIYPIVPRESLWPHWNEWVCFIWLSGLLLGQLTSPQDRAGFGMIKVVIIGGFRTNLSKTKQINLKFL